MVQIRAEFSWSAIATLPVFLLSSTMHISLHGDGGTGKSVNNLSNYLLTCTFRTVTYLKRITMHFAVAIETVH